MKNFMKNKMTNKVEICVLCKKLISSTEIKNDLAFEISKEDLFKALPPSNKELRLMIELRNKKKISFY